MRSLLVEGLVCAKVSDWRFPKVPRRSSWSVQGWSYTQPIILAIGGGVNDLYAFSHDHSLYQRYVPWLLVKKSRAVDLRGSLNLNSCKNDCVESLKAAGRNGIWVYIFDGTHSYKFPSYVTWFTGGYYLTFVRFNDASQFSSPFWVLTVVCITFLTPYPNTKFQPETSLHWIKDANHACYKPEQLSWFEQPQFVAYCIFLLWSVKLPS